MKPYHCRCRIRLEAIGLWLLLFFTCNNNDAGTRVSALSSTATSNSKAPVAVSGTASASLAVCTGIDCRLEGASGCLRRIQEEASRVNNKSIQQHAPPKGEDNQSGNKILSSKTIAVVARPCLGPCGDGPNVVVLNDKGQRVVSPSEQPHRGPGSWAPPALFGDNPRGVYQVRTQGHLDFVLNLAAETAAATYNNTTIITTPSTGLIVEKTDATTTTIQHHDPLATTTIASSCRPWYDRPRNDRRVLQRCMQALVLAGLYQYDQSHAEGAIGQEQYIIAGMLFLASNWIMRENIVVFLCDKIFRKSK
ncbi:hypothetical protein ACA910_013533 [Epithemia clementina (nom. ined.)]